MPIVLKTVLRLAGLRQSDLARELCLSKTAMNLLCSRDQWPKTRERAVLETQVLAWLESRGVYRPDVFEVEPDHCNDPAPSSHEAATHEGDEMLLDPQPLSQRARERFGLRRNPFDPDLEGPDDVFLTASLRERLLDMESAVLNRRFIAIYGESGSGKTTLRRLLLSRVADQAVIVRPLTTIGMAENDRKGQTLRIDDIYHAIINSIDPTERLQRKREARARQIGSLMAEVGKPVCLVIEEAHRMPTVTLQSLKGLREIDEGFGPALGVLLVGHQELDTRLSKVREVGQRAQRCEMPPLNRSELREYMAHRFARVGCELSKVFEPAAVDALAGRLTREQIVRTGGADKKMKVNLAYPLHVGNMAVSIMNLAASLGSPTVCEQTVAEWNQTGRKGA